MKNLPETLLKRNQLKKFYKDTIDPASFPHEIVKKCKDCKQNKLCKWQSSFSQTGKPEYRARCNDCFSVYLKSVRKKPEIKAQRNIKRREFFNQKKQKIVDQFGGKCEICGYDKSLAALTFHHKNPSQKEYTLGQILDYSDELLKKELDKCRLLCHNCHSELHEEERNKL